MPTYWPEQWELIQEIQQLKREEFDLAGADVYRSDANVQINPMTGQEVPIADLEYARDHLWELIESGEIRDERWAFLWYH